MIKVLILCTGNSCRSQMAEGFINAAKDSKIVAKSAGVRPSGKNPIAIKVMEEIGVDISSQASESVDEYLDQSFDYVLTVCDHAKDKCPVWPGNGEKVHHSFEDPADATGTDEEILNTYRRVRDEIKEYCKNWSKQLTEQV